MLLLLEKFLKAAGYGFVRCEPRLSLDLPTLERVLTLLFPQLMVRAVSLKGTLQSKRLRMIPRLPSS
jgi:hypothetical protein